MKEKLGRRKKIKHSTKEKGRKMKPNIQFPRMKKILSNEVCRGFGAKTCCSLNCC
jgi:hypothetical protein